METIEVIELCGVGVALILGVISFFISKKSNRIAAEANELSKKSNELSKKSIDISEEIAGLNKENVKFSNITNILIIKNDKDGKIEFGKNKSYAEYIILFFIRITNLSLQPVTIEDFSLSLGKGKDSSYVYINKDDVPDIKSYETVYGTKVPKNLNTFPLYLQGNKSEEITIMAELSNSDYHKFLNKGAEITFDTTSSRKNLFMSSDNVIEY